MILNLIQNEKFEENARFKRGGNCLQRLSSPLVKARAEDLLQLGLPRIALMTAKRGLQCQHFVGLSATRKPLSPLSSDWIELGCPHFLTNAQSYIIILNGRYPCPFHPIAHTTNFSLSLMEIFYLLLWWGRLREFTGTRPNSDGKQKFKIQNRHFFSFWALNAKKQIDFQCLKQSWHCPKRPRKRLSS